MAIKKVRRRSIPDGPPKKIRKPRKPLTEDQKAERAERLAVARAKRKPSEHKSVHYSVPRDDSSPVNVKSVRSWIKTNQERLAAAKQSLKLNPKNRELSNECNIIETYIHNLQAYLRTGIWLDLRWGENMEGKMAKIVRVNAYHWHPADPYKGMIKREIGTMYPDVGLWTAEMHEEYYGIPEVEETKPKVKKKTRRKRKPK